MGEAAAIDTALTAATITPALRSVLIFDAEPAELCRLADRWAGQLEAFTGEAVPIRYLGSSEGDDDVWGRSVPQVAGGRWHFEHQPGPVNADGPGVLPLVVVADLTRLSLAANRAAVVLVGADVAHVERHLVQRTWVPRSVWLAACPARAAGQLSPHLLDRFALRLHAAPASRSGEELLARLRDSASPDRLRLPGGVVPGAATLTPAAVERVVALTGTAGGARRDLALARLASALARLEGRDTVSVGVVDDAARLIGLQPPSASGAEAEKLPPGAGQPPQPSPAPAPPGIAPGPAAVEAGDASTAFDDGRGEASDDRTPMPVATGAPEPLEGLVLGVDASPYPEDLLTPSRDVASLKVPAVGRHGIKRSRGPVVGTTTRIDVHDIDFVATLFEAAKYQVPRRRNRPHAGPGMLVSPSDLRSRRRGPVRDHLLVLVLDHTCRGVWDWAPALAPWVRQAYLARAGVAVVLVGAAALGTEPGVQATQVLARSLLDPRVRQAIDAPPGCATPLAHGLDLALQTLRHGLQHGSSTVSQAWLVVATDGRGNVPLAASRAGRPPERVSTEGIDDALAVARELAVLGRVTRIVVTPRLSVYPDLPFRLAEALGAEVFIEPDGDAG